MYVNVGARRDDGRRFPSKKALKDALRCDPATVTFDVTSLFHTGPSHYRANDLPQGIKFSVVGPDPFNNRRWYANVERNGEAVRVK